MLFPHRTLGASDEGSGLRVTVSLRIRSAPSHSLDLSVSRSLGLSISRSLALLVSRPRGILASRSLAQTVYPLSLNRAPGTSHLNANIRHHSPLHRTSHLLTTHPPGNTVHAPVPQHLDTDTGLPPLDLFDSTPWVAPPPSNTLFNNNNNTSHPRLAIIASVDRKSRVAEWALGPELAQTSPSSRDGRSIAPSGIRNSSYSHQPATAGVGVARTPPSQSTIHTTDY